MRITDKFFGGKTELQQKAFELFAQGLLFDNGVDDKGQPRRPSGDKIHMMDSKVLGYVVLARIYARSKPFRFGY